MNEQDQNNFESNMDKLGAEVLEKSKDMAKKLPVLGHVTWLYCQSKQHRHYFIQDIESRIMPAIILEQCKLYVQTQAGGLPMAFASWAYLNEAAEERYLATQRLSPADWKSGDRLWLIDIITPFGGADAIYKELYYDVLKDQSIHILLPHGTSSFRKTTITELMEMRDKKKAKDSETKH